MPTDWDETIRKVKEWGGADLSDVTLVGFLSWFYQQDEEDQAQIARRVEEAIEHARHRGEQFEVIVIGLQILRHVLAG